MQFSDNSVGTHAAWSKQKGGEWEGQKLELPALGSSRVLCVAKGLCIGCLASSFHCQSRASG